MRRFTLSFVLGLMVFSFVGCGDDPGPAKKPAEGGPALPGVPTDGPEALKTPAKTKK